MMANIGYASRKCQQQFSTADLQQSRTYSSKFSKSKARKTNNNNNINNISNIAGNNNAKQLPYFKQKAAIIIQRFWRGHQHIRRKYYQQLYQQLFYNNQATISIIKQQQNCLQGLNSQIQALERLNKIAVDRTNHNIKSIMKGLAKDCVAMSFKMEKRKLSEEQLGKLLSERGQIQEYIGELKDKKKQLQSEVIFKTSEAEQLILREIKQANRQLLKIVSQRNLLKQKLREKKIYQSSFQ